MIAFYEIDEFLFIENYNNINKFYLKKNLIIVQVYLSSENKFFLNKIILLLI